nr:response regulator [Delftia acidovorans]
MQLILIVEDEYGAAEIMQLVLGAEGYEVLVASNGKEAMEIIESGKVPDLIISDFMMPVMNGGEFGRFVDRNEQLDKTPFVFMSGTSEDVVRQVYENYDDFLVKPFDIDALLNTVSRLINVDVTMRKASRSAESSVQGLLKKIKLPE